MSLHVLDTDTLSLLQEGHATAVARVAACPPEDLAITVISVEEQLSVRPQGNGQGRPQGNGQGRPPRG